MAGGVGTVTNVNYEDRGLIVDGLHLYKLRRPEVRAICRKHEIEFDMANSKHELMKRLQIVALQQELDAKRAQAASEMARDQDRREKTEARS